MNLLSLTALCAAICPREDKRTTGGRVVLCCVVQDERDPLGLHLKTTGGGSTVEWKLEWDVMTPLIAWMFSLSASVFASRSTRSFWSHGRFVIQNLATRRLGLGPTHRGPGYTGGEQKQVMDRSDKHPLMLPQTFGPSVIPHKPKQNKFTRAQPLSLDKIRPHIYSNNCPHKCLELNKSIKQFLSRAILLSHEAIFTFKCENVIYQSVSQQELCVNIWPETAAFSVCLAFCLIDEEEGKVLTAQTSSCVSHNDMSTSDK